MTQLSYLGYYVVGLSSYDGVNDNVLSAEYPVSTNHAAYVLNNLQHLYDESTQVRVSWVATLANAISDTGGTQNEYFHLASYYFPLSFGWEGGFPECLTVRVAAAAPTSEGDPYTANIAAVLCPAYQPISPADIATGAYWAILTGSTVSTVGEWVIQDIMDDYSQYVPPSFGVSYIDSHRFAEADLNYYKSRVHMARLSIFGYVTDNLQPIYLMGVSAREFRKTVV